MTQNADGAIWANRSRLSRTAAGSMHDVKNLITTSHAVRMKAKVFVQQPGLCMTVKIYSRRHDKRECEEFSKWGVPFGPTVLGYPPSDCSAVFTTRTPIHPYNTSFSQNLKICRRWHLRAKSLRRRHEFRSNFGIFLGLLPPRGATTPKYGLR